MAEVGNTYLIELKKFIGQQVVVTTVDGNTIKGICRAIDFNHLNVIIMTDEEKIIVKNVRNINRVRDKTSWSTNTK